MNSTLIDTYGRDAEERRVLREKIDLLNREAAENWDNPSWRREMAQELTTTLLEGFEHENLLNLFATVENVGFNGRITIKETRGLRAFWSARGGYIEASTIRQDVVELPRDMIGFHVYEFEDKLRDNFAETQANLVDLGIQRMDAEINLRVLRLFQAAVPTTSPYYISGAGLGLPALHTALREVRDATRGGEVTIIGRSTMTDQIIDELTAAGTNVGFTPETNEDILRRGVLGTYRGARILTLTNFKDDEDVPFFPANEMYVVSRDAAKFGFWGGLLSKEYTEDDNWYWHYLARRDFGGMVYRPDRLRRIVDTTITP